MSWMENGHIDHWENMADVVRRQVEDEFEQKNQKGEPSTNGREQYGHQEK